MLHPPLIDAAIQGKVSPKPGLVLAYIFPWGTGEAFLHRFQKKDETIDGVSVLAILWLYSALRLATKLGYRW